MKKIIALFLVGIAAAAFSSFAWAEGTNIVRINQNIEIAPEVTAEDVVAIRGDITVYGRVRGSVVSIGGTIYLKALSVVDGEVVAVGGEIVRDPQAHISGRITQVGIPKMQPLMKTLLQGKWIAVLTAMSILIFLGFLGLSLLLLAFLPKHMETIVFSLQSSFLLMLVWGIAWIVLVIPIAIVLAISIVGLIFIPFEIVLVILALIIGYIAAGLFIGKNVSVSFKKSVPIWLEAIIGLALLYCIGFIPVIGGIVKGLFLLAGFGAVITSRFGMA